MPRIVKVLSLVLLVFAIAFAWLVFNPALIARPLLESSLASTGFRLKELENLQLGKGSARASKLVLESEAYSVEITDLQISFTLGQLLDSRIEKLTIDAVELRQHTGNAISDAEARFSPTQYLELLSTLPVSEVVIGNSSLILTAGEVDAVLRLSTAPLNLDISGSWLGETAIPFAVQAESSNSDLVDAQLQLGPEDDLIADMRGQFELTDSDISLSSEWTVDTYRTLQAFNSEARIADWVVLNNQFSGVLQSEITTTGDVPALNSMTLSIQTGGSSLLLQRQSEQSNSLLQLNMPATVTLSSGSETGEMDVAVSDLYGTFSSTNPENELHLEATLNAITFVCDSQLDCDGESHVQINSPALRWSEIVGENISASGQLVASYEENALELTGEELTVVAELIRSGEWQAKAEFSLPESTLVLGEENQARVEFSSSSISVSSELASLLNPELNGEIDFAGSDIAIVSRANLGTSANQENSLLMAYFQHNLESQSGSGRLSIEGFDFSETPLSSMLEQQWLSTDITSGLMSGQADIDWSIDENGFNVAGPVTLEAADLSGHIEDTLFIGFSTVAEAQLEDWRTLVSSETLTATIETVDAGLPINNLQWQYAFNTSVPELMVSELNSDFFGGKVEIADFTYDPSLSEQELTVVLSRLDLESIVGLAGYPEIFVDGLISGYIPLILREGKILVEEGLVGALQPGGNIRYTPEIAATDVINSTVQLVNDALSNYQYETLDTRVFYDESGDLRMEVELRGINPDMNGGQPINLNVNLTDNIPSLLRSLQAGQEIQDRLEQRLQNR